MIFGKNWDSGDELEGKTFFFFLENTMLFRKKLGKQKPFFSDNFAFIY